MEEKEKDNWTGQSNQYRGGGGGGGEIGEQPSLQWPAPLELNEVSSLVQKDTAKIFSSHIRFNKGPVNSVFPKPNAKYITILRNPIDRFKSAWLFYGYSRTTGVSSDERPLNTFLRSPNALEEIRRNLKTLVSRLSVDGKHFENDDVTKVV